MTIFFVAYNAWDNKGSKLGFRLFTSNSETPEEIAKMLDNKLEQIREELGMNKIIATAFNKV